jgi:pyruvate dehydrogenase E2 component (dihydrolipoamide acetyltransferase)
MQKVLMPKMGDTMEEGKILSWRKQIGDPIRKGDALAEIETEKVNIEVESFAAGVLRKILVPAGQTVPVGTEIALVGDPSEALGDEPDAAPQATAQARASATAGQADAAAPAAVPSAPSRQEAVPIGVAAPSNGHTNSAAAVATAGRLFISPIARRIAAEHQLDVAQIQGTGPGGRIIREDVEAALAQQPAVPAAPAEPFAPAQPAPIEAPGEDVEVVPLTAMRKTIARRLQQSMQTVPHFYMTISIDTTRLAELRASINEYAATLSQPVKVSLNDLIVKAAALALRRVPEVNASFDGERLLIKKRVNIGVAVALDRGLIVPVVRDADKRTVLDIARESRRLIDAARNNTLKPEDFQGGTFSISNAGMYGVESFTAVINPPEAAILAVGAAEPTPVVDDGHVVVRDRMKVTLSSDHRVLDGAVSARFLQELKQLLEQPMSLLM